MKTISACLITGTLFFVAGYYLPKTYHTATSVNQPLNEKEQPTSIHTSGLGAFSISLSVQDLVDSKIFYENLGFTLFGGSLEQNYAIMKNGNALIGLFQGMFEGNILTFNPGWDENAQNLAEFEDIRAIQDKLKKNGVSIQPEIDSTLIGPASFMLTDPDGNVILFDQHR
jgi:predicted enzyme related to lactoylglutathione lyase